MICDSNGVKAIKDGLACLEGIPYGQTYSHNAPFFISDSQFVRRAKCL